MPLRRCLCCKKEPDFLFASSGYFGWVVITLINWDNSHKKCTRLWPILWSGNVQFQGKKILVSLGREISYYQSHLRRTTKQLWEKLLLKLWIYMYLLSVTVPCSFPGVRSKTSDAVSWRMSSACWCPWILDHGTAVKGVQHEHLTNMFITKRSSFILR